MITLLLKLGVDSD